MPETTAAPATPAAPAPQSAAPTPTPPTVAPQKAAASAPEQQSPAQDAPKPDPALERRAAALARTKREAAKVHAEKQRLDAERRDWQQAQQETLRKAQELDRLTKLRDTDSSAFLNEVGLPFDKISKDHIAKLTGAGKTPAELVAAEVDKRFAEKTQAEQKTAAEREEKARIDREQQTLRGAHKQLETLIMGNPERYEFLADAELAPTYAKEAWGLVEKFYKETLDPKTGVGKVLDFDKALDAIEARELQRASERIGKSKKLQSLSEQQKKAEAEAKAKAAAEAAKKTQPLHSFSVTKATRLGEASRLSEANESAPASSPKRRKLRESDYRSIAEQMLAEHRAKLDN